MKTRYVFLLIFLLALLMFCWQAWQEARAERTSFEVLINELSPLDSNHDWAELYVQSGTGSIANFILTDLDGTDSELASEAVTVAADDFIVVHWVSGVDETDLVGDLNENGYIDLYLSDTSLSGTDDQLVLKNGDEILDAVIWSNYDGSIANSELQDNQDLLAGGDWIGNFGPNDQSGAVTLGELDQSLARLDTSDTDTKDDWMILEIATPGEPNVSYDPPAKPSLEAQEIGTGSILLAWEEVALLEYYELYESLVESEYDDPLTNLEAHETSYLATDLDADETYYYKLRAIGEHDLYTDSDELEVQTLSSNEVPVAFLDAPAEAYVGEEVVLDASDSFDPEEEPLIYFWDESLSNPELDILEADDEQAVFTASEDGNFTFTLVVSDGELESKELSVTVEILEQSSNPSEYSDDIVINEILPNPVGTDTEDEFIELKNLGTMAVNLENWQLDDVLDAGSSPYALPNTTIAAGSLLVVKRAESHLALNNSDDEVNLLAPDDELKDSVVYEGSFADNEAYARTTDGDFERTRIITEGEENEFDPDSGQNPTSYSDDIVINEILPNPVGTDTEDEFIELKNLGTMAVNLKNWQLDDVLDAGSNPYTLTDTSIAADGFVVIKRSDSGLALNNDADEVNLLAPDGEERDVIAYEGGFAEGEAYARKASGDFERTDTVTEGEENEFSGGESSFNNSSNTNNSSNSSLTLNSCEPVALMQAKNTLGENLCFEATVTAEWSKLGSKLIYLQTGEEAVQAYSSVEIEASSGDKLKVLGEMAELSYGLRFRITDWKKLDSDEEIQPKSLGSDAFADEYLARLIKVSGVVSRNSGQTFYLSDEAGEVKVTIKSSAGFDKPETPRETYLEVVGILDRTAAGYRVLPRNLEDLGPENTIYITPNSLATTGMGHVGGYAATLLLMILVRKKMFGVF